MYHMNVYNTSCNLSRFVVCTSNPPATIGISPYHTHRRFSAPVASSAVQRYKSSAPTRSAAMAA